MEQIRVWLLGAILCALFCALAERFPADGALHGAVQTVSGLTLLLALLAPLSGGLVRDLALPDLPELSERAEEELRAQSDDALARGIARRLEEYMEERTRLRARFTVSYRDGALRIERAEVYGAYDPDAAAFLTGELGVGKERQKWIESGSDG